MASLPAASAHFDVPTAVRPYTINRVYSGTILAVHLLALLAFVPQFFSWIGFWTMVVGIHVFGQGITIGYHRLLTHRSFKTLPWVEHAFAILGICCLEDSPARWVTVHRIHHVHSDKQPDPHSPLVTFLWSHFGWLMVNNRDAHSLNAMATYSKDILRDPFYMRIEKSPWLLMWIGLAQIPVYFVAGGAIGWIGWGREAALPLGLSLVVWGVYVRIVAVWHITWSVNSLSHMFGYRNYETGEASRNNWFVALLTVGEGWHNNHHEDPSSASVQHRWWEIDISYYEIRLLKALGLAWDVVTPRHVRRREAAAKSA
ncbi:MAG: acyl-CoA desaturase [Planctomycetota bacterium]|nr:acyl-CoA desaturase [Planctomycetota bacterium]